MKTTLLLTWFVAAARLTFSQAPPIKHITITKLESSILIDGKLDEEIWQTAPLVDDFWQHWPNDTIQALVNTEVRVAYDEHYLYVGAICYEEQPEPVVQTMKRDDVGKYWGSDGFSVALDPGNNDKNGYFFGLNAKGAQIDGTLAQRGAKPYLDAFWDDYWLGEVTVSEMGYVYEMAIPFSSVKFNLNNPDWGINFIRNDMKRGAYDLWSRFPMQFDGLDFGYNGQLTFQDDPPSEKSRKLTIVPSLSGSVARDYAANESWKTKLNGGVDAKMGIGSSLSLDVSVYPDFSMVDVDRQYIDFYRFEYYQPEMRSFFLENGDLFSSFGSYDDAQTPTTDNRIKPLYTRRIGMYDWDYVPMVYGARLSGNASEKVRIGLVNVLNESIKDRASQNYSAGSFQWGILKRSAIKGVFTNRQKTDDLSFDKNDFNRTAGLEFDYMNAKGNWTGSAKYHYSFTPENYTSAHFYGGELNYASNLVKITNKVYHVGDNYIADMGFVPRLYHKNDLDDTEFRKGFTEFSNYTGLSIYPDSETFLVLAPGNRLSMYTDTNGNMTDFNGHLELYGELQNRTAFSFFFNYEKAKLLAPKDILDNDKPLAADTYHYQSIGLYAASDKRKKLHVNGMAEYGSFYNGKKTSAHLGLVHRVQPWGNFSLDYDYCRLVFPDAFGTENYHLAAAQAEISFNKKLIWTSLIQYNTQKTNMNVNSMLQWRFKPMSDFFIVFKDDMDTNTRDNKKLQINFKIRYWLNI